MVWLEAPDRVLRGLRVLQRTYLYNLARIIEIVQQHRNIAVRSS